MKVLVAFEKSGSVSQEFRKLGHEVWTIDLQELDLDDPIARSYHLIADLDDDRTIDWIKKMNFDLLIAHPMCTTTSVSGNRYYHCEHETVEEGLEEDCKRCNGVKRFKFWDQFEDIPRRAIEHPVSVISSRYRKPDQYVHPYEFGEDYTKKTGFWLTNLPTLEKTTPNNKPTEEGKERIHKAWLTMSGQELKNFRSKFPKGLSEAMAQQWG